MTLFDFAEEEVIVKNLSEEQSAALKLSGIDFSTLTREEILSIANGNTKVSDLTDESLVEFLKIANCVYRAGYPLVTDQEYDHTFLAKLMKRNPMHPFLQSIEPDADVVFEGKTVELPALMLSTENAFGMEALKKWVTRVKKASQKIGIDFSTLIFKVAPKLDGFAGYDDGKTCYTRGDGRKGTDISRVFERGLQIAQKGSRGLGPGEIVVSKTYFKNVLSGTFAHARNVQASVIKEGELKPLVRRAVEEGAAVFYPFALLPNWQGRWADLEKDFDKIAESVRSSVDFDLDGLVLEIVDEDLKSHMGSTRKFHRWMVAYKENTKKAETKVLDIIPQTGRTGQVTPVILVEPTKLPGATVRRATAHHYGSVRDKGLGIGATIEICRSGDVIPKLVKVLSPGNPLIPAACPSCDSELYWEEDFLKCPNTSECRGQIVNTILHFFSILGNVDGFGPATVEMLYKHNIRSVIEIYRLSAAEFEAMGIGPKDSQNLVDQLQRSRMEQIEDWRFLASLGVSRLGRGSSENLLEHCPLDEVLSLTVEQIKAIAGFGDITSPAIVAGLAKVAPLFRELLALGFNLERTPLVGGLAGDSSESPIAGKLLVFTGAMKHGSRDAMKKEAKSLGAKVGSSISGKTDYLIAGEKVGAKKMADAEAKGVKVLSEEEYLALIGKL